MSLAQAADDLFTGTSKQGALLNAALSPTLLDTSVIEVASTVHASSPVSPKDVPIPETPIVNHREQKLQEEIERLRSQLEQKNQIISRHETTIETVQNSVHCPICLDPLWKPFVVVPCGHMACQGCLISWFTSPPPGAADQPDERPRQKRKTCPHCRGLVTSRPVEVYGLGGVVTTLHPDHPPSTLNDNVTAATVDPWADIFRPPPALPLRDDEDRVRRCPSCMYEIWDGECVGCGLTFSDVSGHTAFGSDDGSISIFDDEPRSIYNGGGSLYGGTLYGDEGSNASSGGSLYEEDVVPDPNYPPRSRVYESYDEDDDEDDSFIDDTELPRPPPAAYFHHYAASDSEDEPEDTGYHSARGFRSSPVPVTRANSYSDSASGSSLSDDDEEEDDFLPGRGRRGRSVETATLPETAEEADDEDDDEEDEASVNPNATIDLASDEDDDEPPIRAVGRRSAAERWGGWSRDDGEPPRGRSLSRRRVMSPEDGSESEYFSD
ncbi:putative RING finger protein C548,05c [Rhizoctonia solani AG-1 IB]|uniref:Putative RING finger protein C548,05c n=1 Tax=Thanatephorus cucumeris (strain AG1-IB / isolate 7/3/14) TaxID=1108050 RepID=M5BUB6_THACB|nr:putative RING finger protein C548,05c [Rhizoctonia solani AG-1 IB]